MRFFKLKLIIAIALLLAFLTFTNIIAYGYYQKNMKIIPIDDIPQLPKDVVSVPQEPKKIVNETPSMPVKNVTQSTPVKPTPPPVQVVVQQRKTRAS